MRWYKVIAPLLFVLAFARLTASESGNAVGTPEPQAVHAVVDTYRDVPKGVVLEDGALGMEAITSLTYDKNTNTFTINGKATYVNPVSRKDFVRVLKAVRKDDLLGVTLVDGDLRTYGDLGVESQMAKELSETDRFLGGVIYGIERLLNETKLPGNYKVQKAENRSVAVVAFTSFTGYTFEKKDNIYTRTGLTLNVMLIPLADKKSTTGGHLPDEKKLTSYQMEKADKANIDHLKTHQAEYIKLPAFVKTVAWGEAAAFARTIRDSKVDADKLLKAMK